MKEQQRREFEAQLERANYRAAYELLNDPKKVLLRSFYENHFDEIEDILRYTKPRMTLEEYKALDPTMASELYEDRLFVYQVNLAIVDGVLTKDNF